MNDIQEKKKISLPKLFYLNKDVILQTFANYQNIFIKMIKLLLH